MKILPEEPEKKKKLERMAKKIMIKYPQYDYIFSLDLAEELYDNGIRPEMLRATFYKPPLYLEEIIFHLARKLERKNKIIPFKINHKELPKKNKKVKRLLRRI